MSSKKLNCFDIHLEKWILKEQMLAVVVFKLLHYITKDWSKNSGAIFPLVVTSPSVLGFTLSRTHT